jgi:protein-L-isoaspartate O-methyltransferase
MASDDRPATRDIAEYERAYRDSGFEAVQARFRKRLLLGLLERLRPERVLEVGCGLDSLANHWTAAARFVVVEPGKGFAQAARNDLADRADVEVIEAKIEDVEARALGPFDLILVSSLLHEAPDPGAILATLHGIADGGAVVHVNVPNANSFHRLLAVEMGLIQDATAMSDMQRKLQQQRVFTQQSLAALAKAQGFEVTEAGSYFVKPFTHDQMQRLQADGVMTPQMLEGLWGMARYMPDLGSEIFVNLRRAS